MPKAKQARHHTTRHRPYPHSSATAAKAAEGDITQTTAEDDAKSYLRYSSREDWLRKAADKYGGISNDGDELALITRFAEKAELDYDPAVQTPFNGYGLVKQAFMNAHKSKDFPENESAEKLFEKNMPTREAGRQEKNTRKRGKKNGTRTRRNRKRQGRTRRRRRAKRRRTRR